MSRIPKVCCAILVLGAFGSGAMAAVFENGNELYRHCQNEQAESAEQKDTSAGWCLGYILGAYDAVGKNYAICIPSGVTTGQLKNVVMDWLLNHPEKRDLPAAGLVLDALLEKFPCA